MHVLVPVVVRPSRRPPGPATSVTPLWILLLMGLALAACTSGSPVRSGPGPRAISHGRASYYGERFHGRPTASGEPFDVHAMTAAHRTLPFGTRVKVTNLANGRSVIVRINDRGPESVRRIIDLSRAAAARLGMLSSGETPVMLEVL